MSAALPLPGDLVRISRQDGDILVQPMCSLDSREALDALWDDVDDAVDEQLGNIVIDLSSVDFMNSEALELLLDMRDQLATDNATIHTCNATDTVAQILAVTRFNALIPSLDGDAAHEKKPFTGPRGHLGQLLVERNAITEEQLAEAVAMQRQSGLALGETIVKRGWVDELTMLRTLAEHLDLPIYDPVDQPYDLAIAALLPLNIANELDALPLFKVRANAYVAMADPRNLPDLQELEERLECNVMPVIAERNAISEAIRELVAASPEAARLLDKSDTDVEVVESNEIDDDATIDRLAAGSPVINLVNSIIQTAIENEASDIHIEPFRTRSRVRMRIDGTLIEGQTLKSSLHAPVVSRLKVMSRLDISERRLPQDGRITVSTRGRSVELRFSSLPGLHGEKVVLRVLDSNRGVVPVGDLGMSEINLQRFLRFLKFRHGLILVTGPTGSGKTTTLYSALNEINAITKNTVTIEDPVEYQLDIINQNEVRANIGLTFGKLLTHVLRQDPDVIMLGEIRDQETAQTAVQAALTGHLVLSTLHTNDAVGAITRMIDMGVEPYLLSSALKGVIAQRLLRRNCHRCKSPYEVPQAVIERLSLIDADLSRVQRGEGCAACHKTGYSGRLAIHETLPVNDELERLIVANPGRNEFSEYLLQSGHKTLRDDGFRLVMDGQTTFDELAQAVALEQAS